MSVCGMKAAAHWTNALRRKIRKSHGRLYAAFLTTLFVTTALTWPTDSWAQCAPDPVVAGDNVVCGPNNVTDGFTFEGPGDLGSFRVEEGATVDNSTAPVGNPFTSPGVIDIYSSIGTPGIAGDVTIEGTIIDKIGFSDGIFVQGSIGGSFLNSSTGTIIGGDRNGSGVFLGDIAGDFTNHGRMSGLWSGASAGDIAGAFTNTGTITGTISGLSFDEVGTFTNSGTITGGGTDADGILATSLTGAFNNMAGGMISGTRHGLSVFRDVGEFTNAGTIIGGADGVVVDKGGIASLTNRGLIKGGNFAVRAPGAGNSLIENYGEMTGSVDLGGGDNAFNNMAGACSTQTQSSISAAATCSTPAPSRRAASAPFRTSRQ